MDQILLIVNTRKSTALNLAYRLIGWGKKRTIGFVAPSHESAMLGLPEFDWNIETNPVKFGVVIGGDGTFLRASRMVMDYDIPLYGINVGRLGFLVTGNPDNAEEEIEKILSGAYRIQKRQALKGSVTRKGSLVHVLYALNDLVITKGPLARLIEVESRVNGYFLSLLPADGIIVSTPTGSTAYALSAGGPILPPHVNAMVMVPICPHTLYARPLVLGSEDTISLIPKSDQKEIYLTQDGQLGYELMVKDRIDISIARDKCVSTIELKEDNYFDLLREKLQWGNVSVRQGEEDW